MPDNTLGFFVVEKFGNLGGGGGGAWATPAPKGTMVLLCYWDHLLCSKDIRLVMISSVAGSHRQLYHEVDWTPGPSVMIIGGETTGLSEDAHEFARARGGVYVRIPLVSNVECLSAGTAGAIILYEALRQLHSSSD